MEVTFISLEICFPAIDAEHFQNIAINIFRAESICRLTMGLAVVKSTKRYIKVGRGKAADTWVRRTSKIRTAFQKVMAPYGRRVDLNLESHSQYLVLKPTPLT